MNKVQYAFIDSGIGGLPYLQHLLHIEPDASAVFIADTGHFPYGTKTETELQNIALELVKTVVKRFNPEIVVLACNTLSVVALQTIRQHFSLPIVGTVPAIKLGIESTRTGNVVLIATERSIADPYTAHLIEEFSNGKNVILKAEQELVWKIENGLLFASNAEKEKTIAPIIHFCRQKNADCLVLGCTHYLILKETFIKLAYEAGGGIQIIESLHGVINQVLKLSPKHVEKTKTMFYTTSKLDTTNEKKYNAICTYFNIKNGGLL